MTSGKNHDDRSEDPDTGAKGAGNVGFVIDGIDLRSVGPNDIQIVFDEDFGDEGQHLTVGDDLTGTDESQYKLSDARTVNNSRLPPLWPEDLIAPEPEKQKAKSLVPRATTESSTSKSQLVKEYHARASSRRFRITANSSMYFPQMSFGAGVKYSGNITHSQIAMIIFMSARNEALRVHAKEIGCEHLLLGLIENHGFAAGQLLLALHLNGTGRPWALGDLLAKAKRSLRKHSTDIRTTSGATSDSGFARGEQPLLANGAVDMCFTPEAEQLLLESMHIAAESGYPQVSTKHLLKALLGADSPASEEMLEDLAITKAEIRNALKVCPETDDSREFVSYFLCSIIHAIVRFRLFPGPVRKYKPYSTNKKKQVKKKKQ